MVLVEAGTPASVLGMGYCVLWYRVLHSPAGTCENPLLWRVRACPFVQWGLR